jgi:ABC-type sulfate/molybdate transport systems ATPase subunit
MLEVRGITAGAGSFRLGPLDLAVPSGRVLVVFGPSGAGKSMLLDVIAGFRAPREGRVHLHGADITTLAPERRRIAVVFQDAALFPHLSVRDNIGFAPRIRRDNRSPVVDGLLARFNIAHLADRAPATLSGGERQRVALARALAARPAAILLDEPLSALDQPVREELREVLRDALADLDVPAVHVTHDREEAVRLADDLTVLADGALRRTGPRDLVIDDPHDEISAELLGWGRLGPARRECGGVMIGDLHLNVDPPESGEDALAVVYRPEDVLIGPQALSGPAALRGRCRIAAVLPDRPLARVLLDTRPPITALLRHRELDEISAARGTYVDFALVPTSVRLVTRSTPPAHSPSP